MKKILAAMALFCAAAASAGTPAEDFAKTVNDRAPYEMTDGVTVIQGAMTDDGLTVTYDVQPELFSQMDFISDMLHDALLAELVTSDKPRTLELRKYLKDNNIRVIHRMTCGDRQYDIVILPQEL